MSNQKPISRSLTFSKEHSWLEYTSDYNVLAYVKPQGIIPHSKANTDCIAAWEILVDILAQRWAQVDWFFSHVLNLIFQGILQKLGNCAALLRSFCLWGPTSSQLKTVLYPSINATFISTNVNACLSIHSSLQLKHFNLWNRPILGSSSWIFRDHNPYGSDRTQYGKEGDVDDD
jgi:hypothetical protein